jgi:hypothetical protein
MENNPKTTAADEIDLGVLFGKLGNFFSRVGIAFIRFLALIRNLPVLHKTLFATLTIVGGITAFLYSSYLKKDFFESSMILSSNYLNKRIMESSIEKLNLLAEEKNRLGLAKVLNIQDSVAKKIKKFESVPFIPEEEVLDMTILREQLKSFQSDKKNEAMIEKVVTLLEVENQHAFQITVRTYSPTVVKTIQDALVNYFRKNEYIKKRIEINTLNLLNKKQKLTMESKKLDSLKLVIYSNYKNMAEQSRQGSNNVILSDRAVTNPIEVYNRDLEIYNELQNTERALYILPDFEVVDGFTEFSEPASHRLHISVLIGMGVGFLAGYLFVMLIALNAYLRDYQ